MTEARKRTLLFLLLIAVLFVIRLLLPEGLLRVETLKRSREVLETAVRDRYVLSVMAFMSSYILITGLALPGAAVCTLAGGYLFGVLPTVIYVNIAATTGASIAFLAARYILGDWLQQKYGRQLARFNQEMEKHGARYLLSLRLIPLFPFFLINILSGFTRISFKTFVWTTALGIIPGTSVFAYAGRQLGSIDSPSDILSARILTALVVLALFMVLPVVRSRFRKSIHLHP